jgi:putative ABC transport system permease protein
MAFSVSRRTHEVGIRMALGATAGQVRALILRQGLVQVVLGMVFGLVFAAAMAQLLAVILFDVQARDPSIFGGVILARTATAVLACLVPSRREHFIRIACTPR